MIASPCPTGLKVICLPRVASANTGAPWGLYMTGHHLSLLCTMTRVTRDMNVLGASAEEPVAHTDTTKSGPEGIDQWCPTSRLQSTSRSWEAQRSQNTITNHFWIVSLCITNTVLPTLTLLACDTSLPSVSCSHTSQTILTPEHCTINTSWPGNGVI